MDPASWDARYSETGLVWSAEPNRVLVETWGDRPPGRALDVGTGEGRHAVWLAARGWSVTAVDFSREAIRKARELQARNAPETVDRVRWLERDVLQDSPEETSYDAVLLMYLHLPEPGRGRVLRAAARALAPGGEMLVVGHDSANLEHGVGGPRNPAVLFTADDVVADLLAPDEPETDRPSLSVLRAERVERAVDSGTALDAVVHVRRPA